MTTKISNIKLAIFDIDGTITEIKPEALARNPKLVTPNKLGEQQAKPGVKEKLMGLRDEGQLTMDILFDPATADASYHNALRTDKETRTKRRFELTLTDEDSTAATSLPTFHSFDAYVTGYSITGAVDDAVKASITLEITSAVKTTLRTS